MTLDYLGGPDVITKALIMGRQEGQSQKEEEIESRDVMLLALKMGNGDKSPRVQVGPQSWKGQEWALSLGPTGGRQPCRHLDLAQ